MHQSYTDLAEAHIQSYTNLTQASIAAELVALESMTTKLVAVELVAVESVALLGECILKMFHVKHFVHTHA